MISVSCDLSCDLRQRNRQARTFTLMMMQQTFGISVVGVAMLIQLMLLPTRSMLAFYFGPDMPKMPLPIAGNATSYLGHCGEVISWTKEGGWVAEGSGSVKADELESFLRTSRERGQTLGMFAKVRVRIPPDASAREFIHLVRCMERSGVSAFSLAVIDPRQPWN
jgi:hypothetical protein